MENEAANNLPLGILSGLQLEEQQKSVCREENVPFLALGESADCNPEFVMIQTPPHNLVIYGRVSAVDSIVPWLKGNNPAIPGVIGCRPLVDKFAEAWKKEANCGLEISMQQRIYRLEFVNNFPRQKGRLCCASKSNTNLVAYWFKCFCEETSVEPNKDIANFISNKIKDNRLFLWRDERGIPVSMAVRSRESRNGVVVSGVYTPVEHRNQGYATACVAALSERLQKEGFKFCSLYTDLDNPTSNSIYIKIGYEPVADSAMYRFTQPV